MLGISVEIRNTITRNTKWKEIDIENIDIKTALQYAEVFDFKINNITYNANTNIEELREALQQAKVWVVLAKC